MATSDVHAPFDASPLLPLSMGLSQKEYDYILTHLGRVPTNVELAIFSGLYSEHCSYKSSKKYLSLLPRDGARVLVGPGENAGVIDIGSGMAIVYKIESHNHPSYIEPFQGAATGLGGILRDIFTMGARPIAVMDGLFFGYQKKIGEKDLSLDISYDERILTGVVSGISFYGNAVGVANVGGMTFFDPSYSLNPLVNCFALGIAKKEDVISSHGAYPGDEVIYLGAPTGRDGVRGAVMASDSFLDTHNLKPTVQVGCPFTEKKLLEATLLCQKKKLFRSIQDLGASGLACAFFEMTEKSNVVQKQPIGMEIHLEKVPVRETNLLPYEYMLSESQERMVAIIAKENFDEIKNIFNQYELACEKIGNITSTPSVVIYFNNEKVCDLDPFLAVSPPPIDWPMEERKKKLKKINLTHYPLLEKLQLYIKSPHALSKLPIYEEYDSMIGIRTDTIEGSRVLLLRELDCTKALCLTFDAYPLIASYDPKEGARRAALSSLLKIALCRGAPLGFSDCLNFGSMKDTETVWELKETILGLKEVCEYFNIPIISGNVSLYNQTQDRSINHSILPTLTLTHVGLIEDVLTAKNNDSFASFKNDTSLVWDMILCGDTEPSLVGSSFMSLFGVDGTYEKNDDKPSQTDLVFMKTLFHAIQSLRTNTKASLFLLSNGGLFHRAMKIGIECKKNIKINIPEHVNEDNFLFGESLRLLIFSQAHHTTSVLDILKSFHISSMVVGEASASLASSWNIIVKKSSKDIVLDLLQMSNNDTQTLHKIFSYT